MKFNPLSKWEAFAVIDGVCLAAHIVFPCITATFTTPAGFLFTPKGTAYLSTACSNIYICNATIAPCMRQKLLCFPKIQGHYCRRKSLWNSIFIFNCLIKCFVFKQVKNRCKCFLFYNFRSRFYFSNAWFYITTAFIPIAIEYTTFYNEIAALFFTFLYCMLIQLHCIFINQWPYLVFFFQWITNTDLFVSRN